MGDSDIMEASVPLRATGLHGLDVPLWFEYTFFHHKPRRKTWCNKWRRAPLRNNLFHVTGETKKVTFQAIHALEGRGPDGHVFKAQLTAQRISWIPGKVSRGERRSLQNLPSDKNKSVDTVAPRDSYKLHCISYLSNFEKHAWRRMA